MWDLAKASTFWSEVMPGDYRQGDSEWNGFAFAQFAFPGGGRVEILAPGTDATGFVVKFLRRYGEGMHHVTFVVNDLHAEVVRLREKEQQVFSENYSDPHWMEAFINLPLQGGGRVLVQLAQSDLTVEEQDEAWKRKPLGTVLEEAAKK